MKKEPKQNIKPAKDIKSHEVRDGQSIELLKELHILTRDGNLNQDTRRKLKQVYHLYQFIEPLMSEVFNKKQNVTLVDHGAGKSYLGFILYDLFCNVDKKNATIYGIEIREELVSKSKELATRLNFRNMGFLNLTVSESIEDNSLPKEIDIVTALHACNTATDDAIDFALKHEAKHIILVPCCQAEVATILKKNRNQLENKLLGEIWRHPIHAREFGSHITNVLRCLRLQAHGYDVTATELIGWEHSMKNELIIAKKASKQNMDFIKKLDGLIQELGLEKIKDRFMHI